MICPHCGKETEKKELTPEEMKARIAELEREVAGYRAEKRVREIQEIWDKYQRRPMWHDYYTVTC